MFERYTERARRVLFFARYEASQWGSPSIESEHLLLGLLRERKGLTGRVLAQSNFSLESVRKQIEARIVPREKISTSVEMPFSGETRRILLFAAEESDTLLHNYIGTEHLLLGILREEQSVAGTVLLDNGLRLDDVRQQIVTLLNEHPSSASAESASALEEPLKRLAQENAELRAMIRELEKGRDLPLEFRENATGFVGKGGRPRDPTARRAGMSTGGW